jgi:hypothetical protein
MCDSVHWLGHSVPLGADVIWYSCYHKYLCMSQVAVTHTCLHDACIAIVWVKLQCKFAFKSLILGGKL